METLPDELLEVIFGFTDPETKLQIFRVCKRFNGILSNSTELMKNVGKNLCVNFENVDWTTNQMSDGKSELCLKTLMESKRRFQHFKLLNLQKLPPFIYDEALSTIFGRLGNDLENLNVESTLIDFKAISEITQYLPHLKSTKFTLACKEYYFVPGTFERSFDVEELHLFLNALKGLKELELEFFCHYNLSRDIFPRNFCDIIHYQLEHFKVNRIQINQNFLKFLLAQKNLKHLEIVSSFFAPETTLNDLFDVLLELRQLKIVHLQIYGVTIVKDYVHLHSMTSNIESLTCVILTHTEESHKEFYLRKFIECMTNLKSLKFSTEYCDERKLGWISYLENLRHLELVDCKPDVLNHIHLHHLENLNIQMGPIEHFTKDIADMWIHFFERHPHIRNLHLNGLPIDKKFLLHFYQFLSDLEVLNAEITDTGTAELILEFFHKLKFAKLFLNENISEEIAKLFQRSDFNVNRKFHCLECMKAN